MIEKDFVRAFRKLLDAAIEYKTYEHNGDPWTEDARAMGEMSLDEISFEEIEVYKGLLFIAELKQKNQQ